MATRFSDVLLLVIGVLLFLVSAAADRLGIGAAPGLGWKQVAGIVVGVIIAAVAAVRLRHGERGNGGQS